VSDSEHNARDGGARYLLRRLLPFAWRRRGAMALVALGMVLDIGFTLLQPWPLKVLVDNVLRGRPLHGVLLSVFQALPGSHGRIALLDWTVAAGVAIFLLTGAVGLLSAWAAIRFGAQLSYDMAGALFAHIQRLSLRFHATHGIGSSLRRIMGDSGAVTTIVQDGALPGLTAFASLASIAVVMVVLDPLLTLLALAVIPPMALVVRFTSGAMTERSYAQQEAEGELYDTVEQTLTGIAVVRSFRGEEAADRRLAANVERIMRATVRMTWAQTRFSLLLGLITALGTAGVFLVGAHQELHGAISLGTILVFLTYLGSLFAPVHDVSHAGGTIAESLGSALRVVEVLDAVSDVSNVEGAVPLPEVRGEVAVRDVSFAYEPGRPVLHRVSFSVGPGEVVALVGPTGAGKSTLAGLVPRFYDPDAGQVLLDRRDLRELPLAQVRGAVSLVLQDSFLFPVSVAENIAFGRPGAALDEIVQAARAANALDFVQRLPEGFGTVLGERGASLSGGERQRLAIARALLKDAPVLVLDEPTSALDVETEGQVFSALERLMEGRAVIVIAHRLSTVRRADRILVLRDGQLVEQGRHDELVALDGHYARMHAMQFTDG
jgi:ATP-binding cassette, subfamily B, bacterial